MPAIYAHMSFGEEVTKTLPTPYAELIQRFPEAFCLGTQGPDILFYHKPLKSNDIRKKGTILHTWSGEKFFLAQGKKLLENAPNGDVESLLNNNEAFAAYICGFLCHFTLDTLCHPYIDANSNDAVSHGKIESEFDKYVFRMNGMPFRGYNAAKRIVNKNGVKEAVAKTVEVDKKAVILSMKTMRNINAWFSNKHELSHWFAHTLLKIINKDHTFGDMFLHKEDDPLCVDINATLIEKFKDAIPTASALIQQYFENLRTWVTNQHCGNNLFRYDFSGIIKTED